MLNKSNRIKRSFVKTLFASENVIDFKNSRKPKTEDKIFNYFLQETFYALAYYELSDIKISNIVTIIAVENELPQVFVKGIRPYIKPLIEVREKFRLTFLT